MNPVADPALAIKDGLYVEPPGRSVADDLALRLELEPVSTHLVLGGIGSGKTTTVLKAEERLRKHLAEVGDLVEYIDVSREHDLAARNVSGVLVALAGLALTEHLTPDLKKLKPLARAIRAIRHHAHAHGEWRPLDDYDDADWPDDSDPNEVYVRVPGVLVPPMEPIPEKIEELIPPLQALRSAHPGDGAHAIFLFDSLDRLPSPERFLDAVEHDLRVLKAAGIGVVIVGPIRFLANNDRAITDLFDHTHFQLPADPEQPAGLDFLKTVLRRRADPGTLPDECMEPLARASGGVMRDLIQLAKLAANEAYASGTSPSRGKWLLVRSTSSAGTSPSGSTTSR